jgi:hypothetical protein
MSTMSRYDKLRAAVELPETWLPQKYPHHLETLVGDYIAESIGPETKGSPPIGIVRDPDGKPWSTWRYPDSTFTRVWNQKKEEAERKAGFAVEPDTGWGVALFHSGETRPSQDDPNKSTYTIRVHFEPPSVGERAKARLVGDLPIDPPATQSEDAKKDDGIPY